MDKMREEYEAWFCSTMEMDLHRFADGYLCHDTNRGWMAWKASRAALCVEIPKDGEASSFGNYVVFDSDDVRAMLDAAGIRYT